MKPEPLGRELGKTLPLFSLSIKHSTGRGLNPFHINRNLFILFIMFLIKDDLSLDVGYAQKSGSDSIDVSPVQLESRDPPALRSGRWLRARSLHSIMIEEKMIEMKV